MEAFKHYTDQRLSHRGRHIIFDTAKKKFADQSLYFKFSEITTAELDEQVLQCRECVLDPKIGASESNDLGNANVPGYLVRRQTRSIAAVIRKNLNRAQYYMFLEDDMRFCRDGFRAIQYLLDKATRYHGHWLAVRASYGMNGIFLPNDDLAVFASYLIAQQQRRPPDHLVVEWFAGETPEAKRHKQDRVNVGFKFNLLDHIGVVSTLRSQKSSSFPRCYEPLLQPTVFEVEAYNPLQCPRDDIWPCRTANPDSPQQLVDWAARGRSRR